MLDGSEFIVDRLARLRAERLALSREWLLDRASCLRCECLQSPHWWHEWEAWILLRLECSPTYYRHGARSSSWRWTLASARRAWSATLLAAATEFGRHRHLASADHERLVLGAMMPGAAWDKTLQASMSPPRIIAECALEAVLFTPGTARLDWSRLTRECATRIYETTLDTVEGVLK